MPIGDIYVSKAKAAQFFLADKLPTLKDVVSHRPRHHLCSNLLRQTLLQRWPRKSGTLNSVWGFQHLDHFRTIVYYYFTKVTSRKKYFCNSVIFFGRSNKSPDSVIIKGAPLSSNQIS